MAGTWHEHLDNACSISIICARCQLCFLHCQCPPPALRAKCPEKLGESLVKKFIKRKVRA